MRGLAFLLSVAIGGCAVMQVDVDVYKGPLSNQEEVQQQQLAVMATSAKPLLIRLRNQMEWKNLRLPPEALEEYITTRREWNSLYAQQVNDVLSLYTDAIPPIVVQFARDAEEHSRKYSVDVEFLRSAGEPSGNGKLWMSLQADLKYPDPEISVHQFIEDAKPPSVNGCYTFARSKLPKQAGFYYMTQAFRMLLDPDFLPADQQSETKYYSSSGLRQVMYCLNDKNVNLQSMAIRKSELLLNLPKDMSSNALFSLFTDPAPRQYYASLLFNHPKGAASLAFQTRLAALAQSYLDAREELNTLLDLSLEMLRQLNGPALVQFDQDNDDFRAGTIHLIASIIQPQYLLTSLCVPWLQHSTAKQQLLNSIQAKSPHDLIFDLASWSGPNFAEADRLIEAMLRDDPGPTIDAIVAAAAALKIMKPDIPRLTCDAPILPPKLFSEPNADADPKTSVFDRTKFGEEFRFGVTRGPTLGGYEAREFAAKTNASLRQIGGPLLGLEHGRLAEGLDTLADRYLRESVSCRDVRRASEDAWALTGGRGEMISSIAQHCANDNWVDDRQKLGNSLVHFSQKLLFIANNDLLLAGNGSHRSAGAGQSEDSDELTEQERRPYVLILQAVGNSILNELDELRARRNHEGAMGMRTHVELETLKRTFSPSPSQLLDELTAELQSSANAETKIASDKKSAADKLNGATPATDLASAKNALAKAAADSATAVSDLNTTRTQAKPILLTYNTLTGGDDSQSVHDLSTLKDAVITSKTGDVDGPTMVDDIVTWLDGQVKSYDSSFQSDPRPLRLTAARDYMKAHRTTMGPADSRPRETVFQALAANIANNKAAADSAVAAKQKAVDAASSDVTIRTAGVESAQNEFNGAKKAAASADTESKEAGKRAGIYEHATAAIGTRKQAILLTFQNDDRPDPKAVYAEVRRVLQNDMPPGGCGDGPMPNNATADTEAATPKGSVANVTRRNPKTPEIKAAGPKAPNANPTASTTQTNPAPPSPAAPSAVNPAPTNGASAASATTSTTSPLEAKGTATKTVASKGSSTAKVTRDASVCDAITAMKNRDAPLAEDGIYLGEVGTYGTSENAQDVLDRLISALQYQQIRIKQSDPSGATAKRLQQAIESAYEYRSGMAYLRPAGAYLRNSYPATSLQADPGLGWSNRLGQQAARTLPFVDKFLEKRGERDLKTQSEIDKQFWQNINSVRVAGAGTTNYVLAKDDIGNWYVKAYSADPKPIIDAATSLAKFSLGAGVPASSLTQSITGGGTGAVTGSNQTNPAGESTTPSGPAATLGGQNAAQSTPAKQQPSQPPLEKLLTLNKTKYDNQTQSEYDHLRNDLGSSQIKASVTSAWKGDTTHFPNGVPDALAQTLTASASVLDTTWKQLADSKKSDEEYSRILTALNSLLTFRNTLNLKIASSLTDAAQIKAAQQDLDQVIGPMLNHEISTRQSTVKNYGTAIGFIGEALKP